MRVTRVRKTWEIDIRKVNRELRLRGQQNRIERSNDVRGMDKRTCDGGVSCSGCGIGLEVVVLRIGESAAVRREATEGSVCKFVPL